MSPPPPLPSKSREPSGPSARMRSSTGSNSSGCSRNARSCQPQCPRPSMTVRKCGHSSIGSSDASCAQYSKTRPAREELRHVLRVERADAGGEREPVRAVDGRDRVELHRREPADRRLDVRLVRRGGSGRRSPARRRSCGGSVRGWRSWTRSTRSYQRIRRRLSSSMSWARWTLARFARGFTSSSLRQPRSSTSVAAWAPRSGSGFGMVRGSRSSCTSSSATWATSEEVRRVQAALVGAAFPAPRPIRADRRRHGRGMGRRRRLP